MITLTGLEGRSEKKINAIFFKNILGVGKLNKDTAVTSAFSNGSINIWIDDEGKFRCESMRYQYSLDKKIYDDIEDVKLWTKYWLKKIK